MSNLADEFAHATQLFRSGQLQAAEQSCRTLLLKAPRHPSVTHLLGLVRKELGDLAGGEILLRESITLEPRQAEFHVNLGNLLRRLKRLADAERSYRTGLSLNPRNREGRIALIRTLNDLGQHAAAETAARTMVQENPSDNVAWSLLAMSLRDQTRLNEAEAAYRQALAISSDDARTRHNLGSVLSRLDRSEEALSELDRAESLGLGGFELAFNRGVALLQLYRIDEAEQAFARAVGLQPLHAEAQVNLARVRFMRGDRDFARELAAAARTHANEPRVQILLGLVMRRSGDLLGAESLLRDVMLKNGASPEVRLALAEVLLESGRLREAEAEALASVSEQPRNSHAVDTLVSILLSRGRPADALPFIRNQRATDPLGQGWIAYEAIAARLLGNETYHKLYDYDRLVRTYDLESPVGWSSMRELNAAAAESLNIRHRFASHPLDQSLRNGSQTARNLLTDNDPAIQALLSAFEIAIDDYQQHLGRDPNHPLSARNRGTASILGAWSVQLRRDGYHVNHVHPKGWVSSAYYVSIPAEINDEIEMSGWLKFGEPRFPVPGAGPEGVVQPKAGRLVLFPSYMWHGTNPIHGDEPRTTIAFDAVPNE